MQLVKGLVLLNATPFWTVYSLRAFAALGGATVPLPPAATDVVRRTLFGYLSDPNTISTFLQQVRATGLSCSAHVCRRGEARHPIEAQ